MIPPVLVLLHLPVRRPCGLRIWIPVVLFWPLLLVGYMLCVPCLMVMDLVHAKRSGRLVDPNRTLAIPSTSWRALCALRGLHVDLPMDHITVRIY